MESKKKKQKGKKIFSYFMYKHFQLVSVFSWIGSRHTVRVKSLPTFRKHLLLRMTSRSPKFFQRWIRTQASLVKLCSRKLIFFKNRNLFWLGGLTSCSSQPTVYKMKQGRIKLQGITLILFSRIMWRQILLKSSFFFAVSRWL